MMLLIKHNHVKNVFKMLKNIELVIFVISRLCETAHNFRLYN